MMPSLVSRTSDREETTMAQPLPISYRRTGFRVASADGVATDEFVPDSGASILSTKPLAIEILECKRREKAMLEATMRRREKVTEKP